MWGAALAQLKLIQPQMRALGEELDFVDRDPLNPASARLRRLHRAYVGLDALKLALAAPLLLSGDGQAD